MMMTSELYPQILNEIQENSIKIYQFPDTDGDQEEAEANKKLRVSLHLWWLDLCQSVLYVGGHSFRCCW